MFCQRYATLAILIIVIQLENFECRLTIKLTNMMCKVHAKDYVNFTLCTMKPINRYIQEVSIYAQILKKPLNNATLQAEIRKIGGQNKNPFFKFEIDCCAFFRNKRRNPAAQYFYDLLGFEKYSNMNHTCPYDHDVIMDKWRINEYHLNLMPVGVGEYYLHSGWFLYNVHAADVDFRFKLFEK